PIPAQSEQLAPAGPPAPPVIPERVKAPPAPAPSPVAPARAAIAPAPRAAAVAPPTPPTPAARVNPPSRPAAPPPAAEEPAYEGHDAQEPAPTRTATAQPEAEPPPRSRSAGGDTGLASVPRPAPVLGSPIKGGGGSGSYFQGSQGGVVGQPVPLDTPDPAYRDYMQKVRQRIYSNWR